MPAFSEPVVEDAALAWLEAHGCTVKGSATVFFEGGLFAVPVRRFCEVA